MRPHDRFNINRHPEHQYLDLLRELIDAPPRQTRNDTATRSIFGRQMRFDLEKGFPLLTTKRVPFRLIALELLWFLSGSTNAKWLEDQGVNIWKEWGDPETREMGPIYGKQMRAWDDSRRAHHQHGDCDDPEDRIVFEKIDQIARVLQGLRDDPRGRRHVLTLWNPADLPDMALPPCHGIAIQFYVGADERLSLFMHQRSGDAFLGVPFNIASYALLLEMFANVLGRRPGEFVHSIGDLHLYGNHVEQAQQQVLREPRRLPTLECRPAWHNDLNGWELSDFILDDYDPWPKIPGEVSA